MTFFALQALAAPVQCDPLEASRILAEARIDENRAPVSHPELLPGLALASPTTDVALRLALQELCSDPSNLSLAPAEIWEAPTWSARTFLLTRNATEGCLLHQHAIAVTVGIAAGAAPRYALRSRQPLGITPIGDCPASPRWIDERVVAGTDAATRLLVTTLQTDGGVQHSAMRVRQATTHGWREQVLLEPAPGRMLDGSGSGPLVSLVEVEGTPWVVAHAFRTESPCVPDPGEVIWSWDPAVEAWNRFDGIEAFDRLAQRGLWRLTDHDGWTVIVAQDDIEDSDLLEARVARYRRRTGVPLQILPSALYPGLNPGFLIAVPGIYPSEDEANRARDAWGIRTRAYTKRAWEAPDACAEGDAAP